MANRFAFQFNGLTDLIRDFQTLPENVIQELDLELATSAEKIVVDAKAAVPKKTNALMISIKNIRDKILHHNVLADKHYAPYVEFGTGSLVDVTHGLEDYAIQFKGRGIKQVNLPARPYLFPAFEEERVKLIDRIKQTLLRNSMSGITVIRPNGNGNITGITTI